MASVKGTAARVTSMTATDAKNEFGRAMDTCCREARWSSLGMTRRKPC